jgi:hypothetical protein
LSCTKFASFRIKFMYVNTAEVSSNFVFTNFKTGRPYDTKFI